MNLTINENKLPFFTLPDLKFRILVDTGSTKSFMRPSLAKKYYNKFIRHDPFEVRTAHGRSTEKYSVNIPAFDIFKSNQTLKFHLFEFHHFFDCLIGFDILQKLGLCLDFSENVMKNKNTRIKIELRDTDSESNRIEVSPQSEQVIELEVQNIKNGDAMIPMIKVGECVIEPGVATVRNGKTLCIINNSSPKSVYFEPKPLILESFDEKYETLRNNNNFNHLTAKNNSDFDFHLIRSDHMNEEEKGKIRTLLEKYKDIFYIEGNDLTFTNKIKHKIITKDEIPIYTKPYRYPHVHKKEVKDQIEKMLNQNIIRPSHSPWSSPLWVVPKKLDSSGKQKWRIVIDYRRLNEKTIDDRYPLPNIEDLLDRLGRCHYFTTLDLASGFYQIEMSEDSISKTAFSTESGHYEYVRMPMGLKNSPSTFQRIMDDVLRGLINDCCLVYLDDIIVYSTSLEEHLKHLKKVLDRLQESNLKIQLDKSEFLKKEVSYLGHIVTPEGVKPNPIKIKAIQAYPIPKTTKEIKAFLGLLGYYRKFIKDFAKITKPLTKCLKKNAKINIHDEEYIECFEKCKTLLSNEPILQYPDFTKQFILTTDASNVALGAVLSQGPIGSDKPVAFASRTLNDHERNYSVIERELLGIVWSVKHFRPYLFGKKFKIVTDHMPLQWLFNSKDCSSRLVRWRLKLSEYDYEIIYKKGSLNRNADALSRVELNTNESKPSTSNQIEETDDNMDISSLMAEITECPDMGSVDIADIDMADVFNETPNEVITDEINETSDQANADDTNATIHSSAENPIIGIPIKDTAVNTGANQIIISQVPHSRADISFKNELHGNKLRYFIQITQGNYEKEITDFITEFIAPKVPYYIYFESDHNDVVYKNVTNVLQTHFKNSQINFIKCTKYLRDIEENEEKISIVKNFHEGISNHRGIDEVVSNIKQTFYWPNIKKTVEDYINDCEVCKLTKYDRHPLKLKFNLTPTAVKPFQIVHIDSISIEGSKFLSIVDSFSKYGQMYLLHSAQSVFIAEKLIEFFTHHGVPEMIVADNGGEFKNAVVKELLELHKVETHFISSQHPESNGIAERFHSTIIEHVRLLNNKIGYQGVSPRVKVLYAVLAYNNTIHSVTKMKPMEVITGHLTNTNPFDIDLEKQILTNYINDHKERSKIIFEKVNANIQTQKEKRIGKANETRVELPQIPDTVYVKDKQKQSKTKNKFKKETITDVNKERNTANIEPTHHNTQQKIHLSNIKRPTTRSITRNIRHFSGSPGPSGSGAAIQ